VVWFATPLAATKIAATREKKGPRVGLPRAGRGGVTNMG
jgi:hypothetical protein